MALHTIPLGSLQLFSNFSLSHLSRLLFPLDSFSIVHVSIYPSSLDLSYTTARSPFIFCTALDFFFFLISVDIDLLASSVLLDFLTLSFQAQNLFSLRSFPFFFIWTTFRSHVIFKKNVLSEFNSNISRSLSPRKHFGQSRSFALSFISHSQQLGIN